MQSFFAPGIVWAYFYVCVHFFLSWSGEGDVSFSTLRADKSQSLQLIIFTGSAVRWNGCALEERRPSWLFRNLCSWVAIFNVSRGGTDCVPKEWIDLAPQQWPCISLLDGGTLKLKVSFTPEQMEIANTAERELCLLCIFLHVGNWTIVITSGIAEYAYKPNNAEFSTFYFYFSRKINCKEIPWRPIC